jgi:type VI secretion system protein ImpL
MNARWLVGAGAWGAFSAAIWFAGDMVAPLETALARVLLIAVTAAFFLGWELRRARKARNEDNALLAGLVGESINADSAERAAQELALLRQRFEQALGVLRKARFRTPDGERRTVARLPWYMFIGAPGSGKTTALLNAALRFPLGDPRAGDYALQGVGGTRNCDWWFTEQAVLLDTAGRYTTQESDRQADATAWLGFLDLLKRFRARQPLNGVIVTLSIADLLHWTEEEFERYARHVRERVAELYSRLGARLPIYLMVTKADLLAGFNEFFSEFDATQRSQVWGTTFDVREEGRGIVERFNEDFARLERRLYELLPARLQETRDLQKRASVYRFAQQFRLTGPLVGRFIEAAFAGTPPGAPPFLRGVYFTSGTQEGSPIDRVLGTLARSFNLERKVQAPAAGAGKSYFLKRLLHEVIFGESGLAGLDPALERRGRCLRLAAYAGFAAIAIVFGTLWTASFLGNRALVASAEMRSAELKRELETQAPLRAGDEAKLLALLSDLRRVRDALESDSPLLRVGFYQGEKLGAQASRAYRNALRDGLLADLALSLENALRAGAAGPMLDAYESLHGQGERDTSAIGRAAAALWALPDAARAELDRHLRAALAERPLVLPRPRDDALIEHARRKGTKT